MEADFINFDSHLLISMTLANNITTSLGARFYLKPRHLLSVICFQLLPVRQYVRRQRPSDPWFDRVSWCLSSADLPSLQSGFRQGHSTETAVLRVLSDILQAVDRGDIGIQLILLDLVAVIDTVDHAISLRVQTTFGIDDSAHWWFQSYLSGRHHYVRHGSARSTIVTSILQCASGFCAGTSSVRLVHRGADTERHVAASVRWRHSRYTYGSYRCLLLWMHFHRRSITECVDAV